MQSGIGARRTNKLSWKKLEMLSNRSLGVVGRVGLQCKEQGGELTGEERVRKLLWRRWQHELKH